MLNIILTCFSLLVVTALTGCGSGFQAANPATPPSIGPSPVDDSVVRGTALITIYADRESPFSSFFKNALLPSAYAASTATSVVTYNNAANVQFVVNFSGLTGGSINASDVLSLGSLTITTLKDNNLNICGVSNNQKCTTAILRVYTTGTVAGFVNTSDPSPYGAPVFTGTLNPTTALTIGSPGVQVNLVSSMPSSKHTVKLSDFSTPTYSVTADFSNAGAGSYSMNYVVEYALAP